MVVKRGRFGDFIACSGFPECKNTKSLNSNGGKSIGVKCPNENCTGDVVERTSKRGKLFYGCNQFPDCTFASWDLPVDKPCPECGSAYLVEKTTKRDGTFLSCAQQGCGYKEIS